MCSKEREILRKKSSVARAFIPSVNIVFQKVVSGESMEWAIMTAATKWSQE